MGKHGFRLGIDEANRSQAEGEEHMSLGINNTDETFPLEVKLMDNEVLRVTQDGQFIWHPDADRMIEEGNFNFNPAMPHILRALRKREWVGLTDEEIETIYAECNVWDKFEYERMLEAKLKEKNT